VPIRAWRRSARTTLSTWRRTPGHGGARGAARSLPARPGERRRPRTQRAKLRALSLLDAFDVVVFSVELGQERQAPSGAVPGRPVRARFGPRPCRRAQRATRPHPRGAADRSAPGGAKVRALNRQRSRSKVGASR